jgi:hypothetical protein
MPDTGPSWAHRPNDDARWHTQWVARRRLSPKLIAVLVLAHLVVTTLTWRDLGERSDTQVRGSKRVWRVVTALNMSNSAAYWLFGRRRSVGSPGV